MFSKFMAKLFFSISLFIILLFPFKTFSYSDSTTHPALTDEIVDFFNLNFKDKALTAEEKEWIVRGVTEEDIMPRWINHFYDPTTGKGWTAEEMGRLSSSTAMTLNNVLLSNQPPLSAKVWAEASDIQSKYKLFDGNRTWQRAVYELAKNNNKKEAYLTLGHVLHLLEDMTVPDHTRNDTHAHPLEGVTGDYGSPYEEYTKKYYRVAGGTNIPVNAESLFNKNFKSTTLTRLADYFDQLSIYSNNHFFSKDTINKYNLPTIINHDGRYGYGRDDNGVFPLAYLKRIWNSEKFSFIDSYILPSSDKDVEGDNKVLNAYFSRLSKEAIINGAGVIKLFFDEVEKVKNGEQVVEEPPKEISGITSVLAVVKQVQNLYSTSVNFVSSFASNLLGIKIASNNQVSSQANTELDVQSTPTPLSEPVNPSATIAPVQTPNPPVPASTPAPPQPVIIEDNLPADSQPIVEPSAPPIIPTAPAQSQPSHILAVGYTPPASPSPEPEPTLPAPVLVEESSTGTPDVLAATSTEPIVTSTVPATTTIEISTTTIITTSTEISTSTISVTTTIDIASSTDTATTTTSTPAVNYAPLAVVINEIAWSGTTDNANRNASNDEWFELYNNTDRDIDLTDWKIFLSGKQMNLKKINNKNIVARGYYLLERTEDSVIRDITADAIFTGSLNNNGEKLELFEPNGEKVDEVDASGGWFAGDNEKQHRSMERLDATKNGSDPDNWQTNQGYRMTGLNFNWLHVYGSPRQPNFGFVVLEQSQEEDVKTLDMKNSPYVVQHYTIPAGKTLNIDPGVDVLLQVNGTLDIKGSLNALGEPNRRVSFLPYVSSSYWGTLKFNNSASSLNFVNLKRGNSVTPRLVQNQNGMILANNSNLTINNALLWDSEGNAIGGADSVLNISNSTIGADIKNRNLYGINTRGGVLNLDNVSFTNLYVGLQAGCSDCSHPELHKTNMPDTNFTNVDYIADPLNWWNQTSSTTP